MSATDLDGGDWEDYDFDDLAEFDEDGPEEDDPEDFADLAEFDDEEEDDEPASIPVKGKTKAESKPEPVVLGRERTNTRASALIATPATEGSEAIRRTLISGHCAFPQTANPEESHGRCRGYTRANPDKIFQPCPCRCHFPEEEYECECGATIVAAPHWPADEDGDTRYLHLDPRTSRIVAEECPR